MVTRRNNRSANSPFSSGKEGNTDTDNRLDGSRSSSNGNNFVPISTARMQNANSKGIRNANAGKENVNGAFLPSTGSGIAKPKKNNKLGIAIGVLCTCLVALLVGGFLFIRYIDTLNSKLTTGNKTAEELEIIDSMLDPSISNSFTEPFWVLLLGSDSRTNDTQGTRSDTNIAVRVDPENNLLTLISIPRDTRVYLENVGYEKFNAAYFYGGAAGVISAASNLLGVTFSHYVEVTFEGLENLIDAVGGVDVTVDTAISDRKADRNYSTTGTYITIEAGEQHLNGAEALVFARSRQYADGDFTRTANQRKLVKAIIAAVASMPLTDVPAVIDAAVETVTTDLQISDVITLIQQFRKNGDITMYSAMVPSTTSTIDEISYVLYDEEATAAMMELANEGKDPSEVETEYATGSSIFDDSTDVVGENIGTESTDAESSDNSGSETSDASN